tara:strand:+ start:87 stop:494 length:408 start_codon:yes stop_codon:yes gene_type:complete
MNFSEIELPSNKKFGYFFTVIFFLIAAYFYSQNSINVASYLGFVGLIFLLVTFFKETLLLPLNKLWMRFGILLSIIVSPVIMGIIFFGLFTPMSLIMRLFRRDELRIRFNNKKTHWIKRNFPNGDELADSFKHQY